MVSFIIVSYNSKKFLADCLQSIKTHTTGEYEVILVENNSGENLDEFASEKVFVHYNPDNKGFGAGINYGSQFARGEWLFFLNPDTQVEGDVQTVILESDDKTGIIGLCLMKDQKVQEYQFGALPTPAGILLQKHKGSWESQPNNLQSVGAVSGGSMLIRTELFRKLSGFDEYFFMYFEDVDLCRRAQEKGYKVVWTNTVTISHYEGGSQPDKVKMKSRYFAGQAKYITKWYGKLWGAVIRVASWLVLLKMRVYNRAN